MGKVSELVLVELTIPADLVAKQAGVHWQQAKDTYVRKAMDEALRVSLGRRKWEQPIVVTCTLEQHGLFCCLLQKHGVGDLLPRIKAELFRPEPKESAHVFNAVDSKPKRIHAPTKALPVIIERGIG